MSNLRIIFLLAFLLPCVAFAQNDLSLVSGLEASADFPESFYLKINDQDEVVNICNLESNWESAIVRSRGGKTIYKFHRESSSQTEFKFSISDFDSGYYFCDIRYKDGKSAMKSFRKF